jgi:hypothetical protein
LSRPSLLRVLHAPLNLEIAEDLLDGSPDRRGQLRRRIGPYAVERHIAHLGIPSTVIGPVAIFENVVSPWRLWGLQKGMLDATLPPHRQVQQIAVADIGGFAALVLERPDEFVGRRVDIASEMVSGAEQAEISPG